MKLWSFKKLEEFSHEDLIRFFINEKLDIYCAPLRSERIDGKYLAEQPMNLLVQILGGPPRAKQRAARTYARCLVEFFRRNGVPVRPHNKPEGSFTDGSTELPNRSLLEAFTTVSADDVQVPFGDEELQSLGVDEVHIDRLRTRRKSIANLRRSLSSKDSFSSGLENRANLLQWTYIDDSGNTQGPFTGIKMHSWWKRGMMHRKRLVKLVTGPSGVSSQFVEIESLGNEPFLSPPGGWSALTLERPSSFSTTMSFPSVADSENRFVIDDANNELGGDCDDLTGDYLGGNSFDSGGRPGNRKSYVAGCAGGSTRARSIYFQDSSLPYDPASVQFLNLPKEIHANSAFDVIIQFPDVLVGSEGWKTGEEVDSKLGDHWVGLFEVGASDASFGDAWYRLPLERLTSACKRGIGMEHNERQNETYALAYSIQWHSDFAPPDTGTYELRYFPDLGGISADKHAKNGLIDGKSTAHSAPLEVLECDSTTLLNLKSVPKLHGRLSAGGRAELAESMLAFEEQIKLLKRQLAAREKDLEEERLLVERLRAEKAEAETNAARATLEQSSRLQNMNSDMAVRAENARRQSIWLENKGRNSEALNAERVNSDALQQQIKGLQGELELLVPLESKLSSSNSEMVRMQKRLDDALNKIARLEADVADSAEARATTLFKTSIKMKKLQQVADEKQEQIEEARRNEAIVQEELAEVQKRLMGMMEVVEETSALQEKIKHLSGEANEKATVEAQLKALQSEMEGSGAVNALREAQQALRLMRQQMESHGVMDDIDDSSPLMRKLAQMQTDGYMESGTVAFDVFHEFENVFSEDDQNELSSNPLYSTLLRRYAQEPRKIRSFLESLSRVLQKGCLPRRDVIMDIRLYWKRQFTKLTWLNMTEEELLDWGKSRPWPRKMGELKMDLPMEDCALIGPPPPPKPEVPANIKFMKRLRLAVDNYERSKAGAHAKHAIVEDMQKEYKEKFGPLPAGYKSPAGMSSRSVATVVQEKQPITPEEFLKVNPDLKIHAEELSRGKTVEAVMKLMKFHPRFKVSNATLVEQFSRVFTAALKKGWVAPEVASAVGRSSSGGSGGGLLAQLQAEKQKRNRKKKRKKKKKVD